MILHLENDCDEIADFSDDGGAGQAIRGLLLGDPSGKCVISVLPVDSLQEGGSHGAISPLCSLKERSDLSLL